MSDFDELPDDVTEEELENIDLSDPEAIAAFLEGRKQPKTDDDDSEADDEQDEDDGDTSGQAKEEDQETEDAQEGDDDKAGAEDKTEEEAEDEEPYVEAADGKNRIPFSVFKGMREENRELKQKYGQLQEQAEKSKKLEAFLEREGIDFEDPDSITDQDLEELSQLDPAVGKLGQALRRLVENRQEQPVEPARQTDNAPNPVEDAIAESSDLTAWRADPDRWKEVQDIDQRLVESGKWDGKPMAERFKEVVRISKLLNGEPVEALSPETKQQREKPADAAAKKVAAARSSAPTSLSNMGKPPSSEKSMAERLSEMSADELQEAMMDMSEAELEKAYEAMEQLGIN